MAYFHFLDSGYLRAKILNTPLSLSEAVITLNDFEQVVNAIDSHIDLSNKIFCRRNTQLTDFLI